MEDVIANGVAYHLYVVALGKENAILADHRRLNTGQPLENAMRSSVRCGLFSNSCELAK